jgi:hypothetical protein
MIIMTSRKLDPNEFREVRNVSLKEYNDRQVQHILVHKWYLSEECGREVSFNIAANDWIKSGLALEFRSKFNVIKNNL